MARFFALAVTVARPLGAHLDFLHIRVDAAQFAAMITLGRQIATDLIKPTGERLRAARATREKSFECFAGTRGLTVVEAPSAASTLSATWLKAPRRPVRQAYIRVQSCGNAGLTGLKGSLRTRLSRTPRQWRCREHHWPRPMGPEFGRISYDGAIASSTAEINQHYYNLGQRDLDAISTLTNFKN
jgi:hypothetical protein